MEEANRKERKKKSKEKMEAEDKSTIEGWEKLGFNYNEAVSLNDTNKRLRGVLINRDFKRIVLNNELDYGEGCRGLIKKYVLEEDIDWRHLNYFCQCVRVYYKKGTELEYIKRPSYKYIINSLKENKDSDDEVKANEELANIWNIYHDVINEKREINKISINISGTKRDHTFTTKKSKLLLLAAMYTLVNSDYMEFEKFVEPYGVNRNQTKDSDQTLYNITKSLFKYLEDTKFPLKDLKTIRFIKELFLVIGLFEDDLADEAAHKRVKYFIKNSNIK